MAFVYKSCTDDQEKLKHACDACGGVENGGVRGVALIDPDTEINTSEIDITDWTAGVSAGGIVPVPATRGSFDGGTAKTVDGFGWQTEKKVGDDYVLTFKDASSVAANRNLWQKAESRKWHIAFATDSLLYIVTDAEVTVSAKAAVEEALDSIITWEVEAKWFSKTKPVIVALPASLKPLFAGCSEVENDSNN